MFHPCRVWRRSLMRAALWMVTSLNTTPTFLWLQSPHILPHLTNKSKDVAFIWSSSSLLSIHANVPYSPRSSSSSFFLCLFDLFVWSYDCKVFFSVFGVFLWQRYCATYRPVKVVLRGHSQFLSTLLRLRKKTFFKTEGLHRFESILISMTEHCRISGELRQNNTHRL